MSTATGAALQLPEISADAEWSGRKSTVNFFQRSM